jgi:hypothetical protein
MLMMVVMVKADNIKDKTFCTYEICILIPRSSNHIMSRLYHKISWKSILEAKILWPEITPDEKHTLRQFHSVHVREDSLSK